MNAVLLRTACLPAALLLLPNLARAQSASQLYTEGVQTHNAGDVAAAKQKLRLSLEVDPNFRPAAALLARIDSDERQGGAQSAGASPQALSKIIVSVDFKDTSLQTAIGTLRQRVSEKSGGKVEVNFVLKLPPELANKKISLQLDRVPATEVLRYMGSLAGVDFKLEPYAVMVIPAGLAVPSPTP